MLRAMRTAAAGMQAQQLFVDTVAHNLANVNTNGFKKVRILFEDLFYQTLKPAGAPGAEAPGGGGPAPVEVGHGVRPVATDRIYTQGDTSLTGNPLDLAIEGDGFFQFLRPDGSIGYSRDGSLHIDGEGRIVSAGGLLLTPEMTVPAEATAIRVDRDGTVSALVLGEREPRVLGQIELARFVNPAGLNAVGGNQLLDSPAAGTPLTGVPGAEGLGTIGQGIVEMSNVKVVEEMVDMIAAQRAYEINSKSIQAADEMLQIANNLRR